MIEAAQADADGRVEKDPPAAVTRILSGNGEDPEAVAAACSLLPTRDLARLMDYQGIRNCLAHYVSGHPDAFVITAQVVRMAKESDAYKAREVIREQRRSEELRAKLAGDDIRQPLWVPDMRRFV